MLRIDSFPPAVAVPPLPQINRSVTPAIEADKLAETKPVALTKPFNGASGGAYSALNQPQMLTYSRQGVAGASLQPFPGRLFDTYV